MMKYIYIGKNDLIKFTDLLNEIMKTRKNRRNAMRFQEWKKDNDICLHGGQIEQMEGFKYLGNKIPKIKEEKTKLKWTK